MMPVLEIQPLEMGYARDVIEVFLKDAALDARLIITSQSVQVAPDILRLLRHLRAFVVGDKTAVMLKELGFAYIKSVYATSSLLTENLKKKLSPKTKLLWLCGLDHTHTVQETLEHAGFDLQILPIYNAHACTILPSDFINLYKSGEIEAVLHYSARSASVLFRLLEAHDCVIPLHKMLHFCLSPHVAAVVRKQNIADHLVKIAPTPSEDSLLQTLTHDYSAVR
jgi:uroporphyrinogen-III synthase